MSYNKDLVVQRDFVFTLLDSTSTEVEIGSIGQDGNTITFSLDVVVPNGHEQEMLTFLLQEASITDIDELKKAMVAKPPSKGELFRMVHELDTADKAELAQHLFKTAHVTLIQK